MLKSAYMSGGKQRIVLVGGGTGGHFYPLIAVAEKLSEAAAAEGRSLGLTYLGPDPYNLSVLTEHGIAFSRIPAGKRRRYFSLLNFLDPFKTLLGFFVALGKLYALYPDVIFSKGGFTSVPVVLAGWFLRIPIVIHESDSRPGAANKLAARFARYIAVSFDEVAASFPEAKTALIGIPLRTTFTEPAENALATLGLPTDRPLLFVTGGSLGAERINNLILETLDELLPTYTILHQTGAQNETRVRSAAAELIRDTGLLSNYFVKGSLSATEMNLAQSAASIIISRAGSGSIFEIAAKGKPSIIIPIPEEISHDQRSNAYAYARTGAASVLEEGNLTDSLLTSEINRIMGDESVYQQMSEAARAFARPEAAQTLAKTLIDIADEHN